MRKISWRHLLACGIVFGLLGMQGTPAQKEEKLKLEDVVAKHVQALGPAEAVKGAKTRRMEGTAEFKILSGGTGNLEGQATYVSDGRKLIFSMEFDDPSYHGEKLNYDGEKLDVATLRPGARTPVGDFLFKNLEIVSEGLFGGVLSVAWPLSDLPSRQAKVKYEGVKTFNGQKVHALRYQCKKQSSDLEIRLFFEEGTFRHVGSQYKASVGTALAQTLHEAARQENLDYTLEESFGGFEDHAGVTLPGKWKITYTRRTPQQGSSIWQWELSLNNAEPKLKKR